jgi:hypothetical protein
MNFLIGYLIVGLAVGQVPAWYEADMKRYPPKDGVRHCPTRLQCLGWGIFGAFFWPIIALMVVGQLVVTFLQGLPLTRLGRWFNEPICKPRIESRGEE